MRLLPFGQRFAGSSCLAIALLAATTLSACNTFGGGGTVVIGAAGPTGVAAGKPKKVTAEDLTPGYCPPLEIRQDTEAITVYDRGHDGEPDFVRHQASIGKTARECHLDGDTLSIKVGAAGNVIGGPKATAGKVTLPIRVVVVKQFDRTKALFTKLYPTPVTFTAPDFRADYTFVQQIAVPVGPNDRDLVVYIGFDEGKKPPSTASTD